MADLIFRELSSKLDVIVENEVDISKSLSASIDSAIMGDMKEGVEGEGSAWTVSTKTRRLAPAFTLSRKDLGTDSPRNIAAVQELAAAKKRGTHESVPTLLWVTETLSPAFKISFPAISAMLTVSGWQID